MENIQFIENAMLISKINYYLDFVIRVLFIIVLILGIWKLFPRK